MRPEHVKGLCDALNLMLLIREDIPDTQPGFWLLNNACCRLAATYWAETGRPDKVSHLLEMRYAREKVN
jgi:hypothetical protein